jgi:6,7-dimethyl-8-ribityllumazine synthase
MTMTSKATSNARQILGRPRAEGVRCAVIASRFNELIVERLTSGAVDALIRHGADPTAVTVIEVPGAWEIPQVAFAAASSGNFDLIVGVGAVIRGETEHFEIVAHQSAAGLADVAVRTGVVVTNAIITVENTDQALARAGGKAGNKGAEAAVAALETLDTVRQIRST